MDYKEWANRYLCKPYINTKKTAEKIKFAIKNDEPLSFTRFGDGELCLLKEYFKIIEDDSYYINLCNADNHITPVNIFTNYEHNTLQYYTKIFQEEIIADYVTNRWNISDKDTSLQILQVIGKNLIFALQNSTLIGIWDINSDILSGTQADFYQWLHSYVPHIELFANSKVDFKSICDGWVVKNDESIANPYKFKEILNGKPIHIFTSNEEELKYVTKLHEILNVDITYTNIKPVKGKWETFSYCYHDFLNNKSKEISEQIILYGLGYGAKYLPSYLAKNYGKTVIDVGSLLDAWSGQITRPFFNDKTYVLPKDTNYVTSNFIP